MQNFLRGSFKTKGVRKSRSETENVDHLGASGCSEVEAGNLEDGMEICGVFQQTFVVVS